MVMCPQLSTEFHRETELQGLREKLGRLEEELEKANRLQVEVSLQLEQSQEERDCLLAVLEGHCSQVRGQIGRASCRERV